MKKILSLVLLALLGLALGGGAAFGTMMLLGPRPAAKPPEVTPAFVDAGKILAPLVFPDGRLSGYVQFQMQIEVPADKVDYVTARMPLLLHAINMRTYRTPMAAGPEGLLPNLETFRRLVMSVAPEAFGPGIVRKVAVTQALPA